MIMYELFTTDFEDVHTLLAKQASIECYTELLDNIVDSCVLQVISEAF